ncbi:hypothetical protein Trydic_g20791 [Trypoxylus dichotomus]
MKSRNERNIGISGIEKIPPVNVIRGHSFRSGQAQQTFLSVSKVVLRLRVVPGILTGHVMKQHLSQQIMVGIEKSSMDGFTLSKDQARTGAPKIAVTKQNIDPVRNIINED